jgi:hypothetical protein
MDQSHLTSMFADREITLRESSTELFVLIKNIIHTLLSSTTRIFQVNPANGKGFPIVLFVGDKCIGINSRSIIAEVYMLPISSAASVTIRPSLPAVEITANEPEMKFWKSAMKAFIERCREWRHLASRELISDAGSKTGICDCGRGESIPDLRWVNQWKEKFSQLVTKIAISTLFTAPYMEQIHRG